jgi:tRNA nucleotidyltransferase (CCA-adding enzyme)
MQRNTARSILRAVLENIQPDKGYETEIFKKLNAIIGKINRGQKTYKAILGGSGAKETWLKTFDADIFVMFDYKKYIGRSGKLSEILEKNLKKKFKGITRLHGSRDYFQIKENNYTFEIVPILKITKSQQAKNITDVSPLHSNWVKKHKKLAGEMRLAKQFCQAQNAYGAESHIRGFSGYVCEILIVHYGSFLGLLRNAAKWQDKAVIDVQKFYRGKDVFKIVNTSKLESPLIVIDPVQKDRNAAAALSIEKFNAFKKSAGKFLKSPSGKYFEEKNMKLEFTKLKSRSNKLVILDFMPLQGKTDVVGSKLLKTYEFLIQQLQRKEFKIIKSGWSMKKHGSAEFYFLFGKKPLPKIMQIAGPPLKIENHVAHFKKIHKKTFTKSGKIFAVEKRKFMFPEDLLKSLLKSPYVRERTKSTRIFAS